MKTVLIMVSGRVQGVYFRAFTQKQAIKHGVTGFVSNKPNGNVEIVAYAKPEKLDCFIIWCHKGPLMAKVEHVIVNDYKTTEIFTEFEIR